LGLKAISVSFEKFDCVQMQNRGSTAQALRGQESGGAQRAAGNRRSQHRRQIAQRLARLSADARCFAGVRDVVALFGAGAGAEAGPGDLVVIYQSGAYGPSASPQAFLGHPQVVEILA